MLYKVQCQGCHLSYVGEAVRKRYTRIKEHKSDVARVSHTARMKTELVDHCWTTVHTLNFFKVTTLARLQRWGQRNLLESWLSDVDPALVNKNCGPLLEILVHLKKA